MADPHFGDLGPDDAPDGIATSREVTLLHCLRQLPEDEALAVADSALRHGELSTLRRVVVNVQGAGSSKVRRFANDARAEAANPFESVTRSVALRVPGLRVEPQVVISSPNVWARPDLVDRDLRLVIECESHEWHSNRESLRKDVRRYTAPPRSRHSEPHCPTARTRPATPPEAQDRSRPGYNGYLSSISALADVTRSATPSANW